VGCGEMRRDRGVFYRCRGGGRRPGDGEVKAAPLMAVCAGYGGVANKGGVRGEGAAGRLLAMARETGGSPVRHGQGAEDGGARSACPREEDEGRARTLAREERGRPGGRPKTTGPARRRGEGGAAGLKTRNGPKFKKKFFSNFN
jgi:hypothetical protein